MPESSDPKDVKQKVVRPALEVLGRLRGGLVMTEISHELNLVTENVLKTGKSGTVTIKLTLASVPNTPNGVVIKAEVDGKPPELAKQTDVFFADEDNNLFTYNPRQKDWVGQQAPRPVRRSTEGDAFDSSTGEITG